MEGSRFVVRHVDVSVAALDTIWRWRGWGSTDPSDRPVQPVRLNCVIADVTNVWEGATLRLIATPVRTELQVRSPGTFGLGELPTQIQKALRYGAGSMRQSADLQLTAAARVLAGRVPSHALIEDLVEQHRHLHGTGERPGLHVVRSF